MNAIINAARAGVSLLNGDMYLYGLDEKGKEIESLPCFICKKMIINAGLNRFIGITSDKKIQIFNIKEWVSDWQQRDILDDSHQYGT